MAEIKTAKPADAIDEADEMVGEEDVTLDGDADADGDTMAALGTVAAEPEGADNSDLLNMFTEVGIETVDRSVLTGLAGEVDMVDLIAELNVVAAAMGIVRAQHDAAVQEHTEQLAA